MDRAQHLAGPALATADDCDDEEEVSRVRLRYPKHLMSCTIALAHKITPSHTVKCLDRDTAGDGIGRAVLSGLRLRNPKHPGVHAGAGVSYYLIRVSNTITKSICKGAAAGLQNANVGSE